MKDGRVEHYAWIGRMWTGRRLERHAFEFNLGMGHAILEVCQMMGWVTMLLCLYCNAIVERDDEDVEMSDSSLSPALDPVGFLINRL